MSLSKRYDEAGVDKKQRLKHKKPVLLICPTSDFDYFPYVGALGVDLFEVAVTYPKADVKLLMAERKVVQPKLTLQLGDANISRRFLSVHDPRMVDDELRAKARAAIGDGFVNLHHHDEFSIRDGLGTVTELAKLLQARGSQFCCVTNHGAVGGWIKQYSTCKESGLKPIFGMEAYMSDYRGTDPDERKKHRKNKHLSLWARTEEGLYNLIRIHNDAQLDGFYYKPRTCHESLKQWGKGVVGGSACLAGEIPVLLMQDRYDDAKRAYEKYAEALDKFYIEITLIEMQEQVEATRRLIQLAQDVGAPLIVSCDSHYLMPEHAETHDLLLLIKSGKTIYDKLDDKEEVWQFDARNLYHRSGEQMYELFKEGFVVESAEAEDGYSHIMYEDDLFTEEVFWQAVENTREIALSIDNIAFDSTPKLPKLYDDSVTVLRKKARSGLKVRGLSKKRRYRDRLKHELGVICDMGFADYFLAMLRIIGDTREKWGEFAVGYGRGSAAGSLVSYCLGLTDINPIKYKLLFERFLDHTRDEPPDIDTDFDPRVRDWVKNHIVEVFGEAKTCSIGTYQTWKTRAVIIDVAKALGVSMWEVVEVTKQLEPKVGDGEEEQVTDQMDFDELCLHFEGLKTFFDAHPEVLVHAKVLRNQVKNMGKHAGGMIISDLDLQDRIPVIRDKNKLIVSAWSEGLATHELSEVGLVKFDILGLKNLSVIADCVENIKRSKGIELTRADLPIDNYEAIRFGSRQEMLGIFQFENPATKPIVDAVMMDSIFDISAVTSLIRPGPKNVGLDLEYARRKHGGEFEMPEFLKSELEETHGIIAYQEDVMRIGQVLGGLSPAESNQLRSAISKKKLDKLPPLKEKFMQGATKWIEKGEVTQEEVDDIWKTFESYGGYGFNRCLSPDTVIEKENGEMCCLFDAKKGDFIKAPGEEPVYVEVVDVMESGEKEVFEVILESGESIICTMEHKFLCEDGEVRPLVDIVSENHLVVVDDSV